VGQIVAADTYTSLVLSGDDGLVVFRDGREYSVWETDFAKFDHSHTEASLKTILGIFRMWGVPSEVIDLWWQSMAGPYRINRRKEGVVIRGEAPPQMATGISITTVANSLTHIAAFLHAVQGDYVSRMAELGFTVKVEKHRDIGMATFLRGWWRRDATGLLRWYPLPSAVLKLGKVRRMRKTDTYPELSAALAYSYGPVPRDYPILGEFIWRMTVRKTTRRLFEESVDQHKPVLTGGTIDREEALWAFETRYGLSLVDIQRMEALISSAPLPGLLHDPGFYVLRAVDYGMEV
jgi:hypothetical protein